MKRSQWIIIVLGIGIFSLIFLFLSRAVTNRIKPTETSEPMVLVDCMWNIKPFSFVDFNQNGFFDPEDKPLEGVSYYIVEFPLHHNLMNGPLGISDSSGRVEIAIPQSGCPVVNAALLAVGNKGFIPTTDNIFYFNDHTVGDLDINVGFVENSNDAEGTSTVISDCSFDIKAFSWLDLNNSGTYDLGEEPLEGVDYYIVEFPSSHNSKSGPLGRSNSEGNAVIRFPDYSCPNVDAALVAIGPMGVTPSTDDIMYFSNNNNSIKDKFFSFGFRRK
jgi:hypothetical protein